MTTGEKVDHGTEASLAELRLSTGGEMKEQTKDKDAEMKDYIRNLNIQECNECEEIHEVQEKHGIKVAPLFWQGHGTEIIPLVIMGMNPSVVGTPNEPQRGCDFEDYFSYYQDRSRSEDENRRLAYWTICHNLARCLIDDETPRWENYVLIEAIHCFYNRKSHLTPSKTRLVANRCFEKFTKDMLYILKPKKMVLLGNPPYEVLRPYLEKEIDDQYCVLNLIGPQQSHVRVPVLRHPHPTGFNKGGLYKPEIYKDFNAYCSNFDYGS